MLIKLEGALMACMAIRGGTFFCGFPKLGVTMINIRSTFTLLPPNCACKYTMYIMFTLYLYIYIYTIIIVSECIYTRAAN